MIEKDYMHSTTVISLVSGKGGSGKTLLATALALGVAEHSKKVLLVDADFGTGGLTYYLGFTSFVGAREGLSEYLLNCGELAPLTPSPHEYVASPSIEAMEKNSSMSYMKLMPVGQHRILDDFGSACTPKFIKNFIKEVSENFDYVIFDCRGGIDQESLSICANSDKIVLIVETDAAAIQASRYLAETLHKQGLGRRLSGFVLNKVIDDPSHLAQAGLSFFKCEHLASIPFEIDTTKSFIKGQLPDLTSLFCRHAFKLLNKLDRHMEKYSNIRVLRPDEYSGFATRNPYARLGGLLMSTLAAYGAMAAIGMYVIGERAILEKYAGIGFIIACLAVVLSSAENFKNALGYSMQTYLETIVGKSGGVLFRKILTTKR